MFSPSVSSFAAADLDLLQEMQEVRGSIAELRCAMSLFGRITDVEERKALLGDNRSLDLYLWASGESLGNMLAAKEQQLAANEQQLALKEQQRTRESLCVVWLLYLSLCCSTAEGPAGGSAA
jgi:hypothetical protein